MGARAEEDRKLIIESGSPMGKHSMSDWRIRQGSDWEKNMNNQLTGGRKVRMAERRFNRIQGKINDARLARLKEAVCYLKSCDWHNDDVLQYVAAAKERSEGMMGFEFSKTNRA